jgi:GNAT superfamily N-acetyltransferase
MIEENAIDLDSLVIEPFKMDSKKTTEFDCGEPLLNDFLCSEEVKNYEDQLLGRTFLVFYRGSLVAYYTVSTGSLRKETIEGSRSVKDFDKLTVEEVPAIVIGRLAVDRRFQKKGIGDHLVQKIRIESLNRERFIARLVLVQAKESAFVFYKNVGFDFVNETRRERSRFRY